VSAEPAERRPGLAIASLAIGLVLAAVLYLTIDLTLGYLAIRGGAEGESTEGSITRPDDLLGWALRPGTSASHTRSGEFDVTYRVDDAGFRAVLRPDSPRRRVWFFGDSYTFGHGVGDADTFAARLAATWRDAGVEVVNAGVNGYGLEQMLGRFERSAPAVRPGDLVVFTPISKDVYRNLGDFIYASQFLLNGGTTIFPTLEGGRLEAVSIVSRWNVLRALFFHGRTSGKTFQKLHRGRTRKASIERAQRVVAVARARCEQLDARFQLVFLPRIKELVRGRYQLDLSGFDFADIREVFPADEAALMQLRFATDSHWNAAGHALGAEGLRAVLEADALAAAP
jgi:hypothetical protein